MIICQKKKKKKTNVKKKQDGGKAIDGGTVLGHTAAHNKPNVYTYIW